MRRAAVVAMVVWGAGSGLGCGDGGSPSGPLDDASGSGGSTSTGHGTTVGSGGSLGTGGGEGGAGGADEPVPFPIPDWPEAAPATMGLDASVLEDASDLAAELDSYCLVVIRHGHVVWERYWQGHDQTTPQKSWSIAKSWSSALVGVAIERGDIGSADDSVATYLPEWQGDEREAITLRHVLSMTSGLSWSLFGDYVSMATLASDHTAYALELPLDEAPGSGWTYHNGGVQILEPVFRNATGMTIEEYAEAHLWSRIGASASWAHDPAGNPTAYATVRASCRDQARLGYLYLHGGTWADEVVLPQSWIQESLTPSQPVNRAYGWLWWLNAETPALSAMMEPWPDRMSPVLPPDAFAARGFGNQFIDVIPSLDMVVVRFAADPVSTFDVGALFEDGRFDEHEAIMGTVVAAVDDAAP